MRIILSIMYHPDTKTQQTTCWFIIFHKNKVSGPRTKKKDDGAINELVYL